MGAASSAWTFCAGERVMRYIILLAGVMIMVAVAHAEIYQWTDRGGGVHFTDNPEKIPPAFRNRVKEVDVTPMIQTTENPAESVAPTEQNGALSYGGHDEMWWRTSFKSLRDEIKNVQDNLPGKRDKLTELRRKKAIYTYARNRIAFNELDDEIKRDEDQVVKLQKRLADLDDKATRDGVPLEWRK